MQNLRAKLHSERGISILFALLLLLAASMVSVVILNAATTAAHRSHDDQLREQDALTLSSAAGVIRDALKAASCTIDSDGAYATITGLGPLQNTLEPMIRRAYGGYWADSNRGTITIEPPSVEGDPLGKVTLTWSMTQDNAATPYRLEGTFTLENSDRKLYLVAYPSTVSRYTVTHSVTKYRTYYNAEGEPVEEPYEDYWDEYFTEFRWDQIVISNQKEESAG